MRRQSEPVGSRGTNCMAGQTQGPAGLKQSGEGRDRVSAGLGTWWANCGRSHQTLGLTEGPWSGAGRLVPGNTGPANPQAPHLRTVLPQGGSACRFPTQSQGRPSPAGTPSQGALPPRVRSTGLSPFLPTAASRMIANSLNRDSPPGTPPRRPDTSTSKISVTVSNKMAAKSAKAAGEGPRAGGGRSRR